MLKGAVLYIMPGTKVLFRSGRLHCPRPHGTPYATLIVDTGAAIKAKYVEFASYCDAPQQSGGLIILGSIADEFSDQLGDYKTIVSEPNFCGCKSVLHNVCFKYLGNNCANLNALTLFKVDAKEISLSNISINFSGDDGLAIFGGSHEIDSLSILFPSGDGLSLDYNAELQVTQQLSIERNNFKNNGDPIVVGPGLVDLLGAPGTTNVLRLNRGACLNLAGKGAEEDGDYDGSGSLEQIANAPREAFYITEFAASNSSLAGTVPE